jgi:hypothetical protein
VNGTLNELILAESRELIAKFLDKETRIEKLVMGLEQVEGYHLWEAFEWGRWVARPEKICKFGLSVGQILQK